MKSRIFVKIRKPKESELSKAGILARISEENFEWLGKVIRKHQSDEVLHEMVRKGETPNITGVKVCNPKGETVAIIQVTKESLEGCYRLDYYRNNSQDLIFSSHMNMLTKLCATVTSRVSGRVIESVANIVTSIFFFLYITHCEDEYGEVEVVPFQVFGQDVF